MDKTNQPSVVLDTLARCNIEERFSNTKLPIYPLQKQALHCSQPEAEGGRGDSAGPVHDGRRPPRAVQTGSDGEAGAGAAGLPGTQPSTGVRQIDRVWADGLPGPQGWPRHQLPGHFWCSVSEFLCLGLSTSSVLTSLLLYSISIWPMCIFSRLSVFDPVNYSCSLRLIVCILF